MELAVGIDLGTTFSAVATVDEFGKPYLVKNGEMEYLTPSVISYQHGEFIIGSEAKEYQALGEEGIAAFFKRNMGDRHFILQFGEQEYNAEDLSAILLTHLKKVAEKTLGNEVKKAVITVPAYFTNPQREATIQAGEKAGLQVLGILNEPTAAAIAYGMSHEKNQTLLVYDLGGGTFDVTLIRYEEDGMTVLATDGDHELGGKNWDDRIVNDVALRFEESYADDPLKNHVTFNELLVLAERAKKQLSSREKVNFSVVHDGNKLRYELTRDHFDSLTQDLLERTQLLAERVLDNKELSWSQLDGVLLVGGSTRMPQVKEWVEKMSGKPVLTGINVDEAVALGAALTASQMTHLDKQAFKLPSKTSFSDVMSHSLGMVAENENRSKYVNSIIIPKNIPVPNEETRPFKLRTRPGDNQIEVYMTQGESDRPLDNEILGLYCFSGIEKIGSSNEAILDISYQYDENGMIQVKAIQQQINKILDLAIKPLPSDLSWMDEAPKDEVMDNFEHLSVIFAIDLSGSMDGNPLEQAQKAAVGFIKQMDLSHSSVGLMSFANSVHLDLDLSQNFNQMQSEIKQWSIGRSLGYGNSAQPFSEAYSLLESLPGHRIIVVLTDGVWSHQDKAIREAHRCHELGIDVIAVGFGGADEQFLKEIASAEEDALMVDLHVLGSSLSKIGQELTQKGGIRFG